MCACVCKRERTRTDSADRFFFICICVVMHNSWTSIADFCHKPTDENIEIPPVAFFLWWSKEWCSSSHQPMLIRKVFNKNHCSDPACSTVRFLSFFCFLNIFFLFPLELLPSPSVFHSFLPLTWCLTILQEDKNKRFYEQNLGATELDPDAGFY